MQLQLREIRYTPKMAKHPSFHSEPWIAAFNTDVKDRAAVQTIWMNHAEGKRLLKSVRMAGMLKGVARFDGKVVIISVK